MPSAITELITPQDICPLPATATVVGVRRIAERVREFVLELPGPVAWEPGAHLDLGVGPGVVRQYSLCSQLAQERRLTIAVQIEPLGRGGSRAVHEHRVGDRVTVHAIRNTFPLVPADHYRFIAGGIGITPFVPMMRRATERGAGVKMLYGGRSTADMAYLADLLEHYGDAVEVWPQDSHGLPDLRRFLSDLPLGTRVYACGPQGLLAAVAVAAADVGCPQTQLQVESFDIGDSTVDTVGDQFEVECVSSQVSFTVESGHTILETARSHGIRVLSSCQQGNCGTCQTPVLEGTPDHRDSYLTDSERAESDSMMICVSRSHSARLVLEL